MHSQMQLHITHVSACLQTAWAYVLAIYHMCVVFAYEELHWTWHATGSLWQSYVYWSAMVMHSQQTCKQLVSFLDQLAKTCMWKSSI